MKLKTLTLITAIAILLSACGSIAGNSLEGTSWELYAISKHSPINGSHIKLKFKDGQVSGHSGCNSFGGDYKVSGNKIKFGMMMSTLMACVDSAMMDQETSFMQMLGNAQRFELADGQLLIFGSGDEALTFVPSD